jgi:hypothetical protein
MTDFESPTYVFDYKSKSNRSSLQSAKVNVARQILVFQEESPSVPSIPAMGLLGADGQFVITVKTPAGEQSHEQSYAGMLEHINAKYPD